MAKKRPALAGADAETQQRILIAAKTVFVRHGTSGARMQEIAEEAGVNQALLHYYFRSKEKLSAAVFRDIAGRIFPALIGALGSDLSLDDKIDLIVATYLTELSRTPFLPGYIISELHHHPERTPELLTFLDGGTITAALQPALAKLGKQLAAEARAGRIRRISANEFVVNLLALCVYPFAARPMLRVALGLDDAAFIRFIDRQKKDLPRYIRSAIER